MQLQNRGIASLKKQNRHYQRDRKSENIVVGSSFPSVVLIECHLPHAFPKGFSRSLLLQICRHRIWWQCKTKTHNEVYPQIHSAAVVSPIRAVQPANSRTAVLQRLAVVCCRTRGSRITAGVGLCLSHTSIFRGKKTRSKRNGGERRPGVPSSSGKKASHTMREGRSFTMWMPDGMKQGTPGEQEATTRVSL